VESPERPLIWLYFLGGIRGRRSHAAALAVEITWGLEIIARGERPPRARTTSPWNFPATNPQFRPYSPDNRLYYAW